MRTVKTESALEIVDQLKRRIGYDLQLCALAQELGVSHSYLSEVLAGKKTPGPKLIRALGYDPTPRYTKKANPDRGTP